MTIRLKVEVLFGKREASHECNKPTREQKWRTSRDARKANGATGQETREQQE
jgi:hypothetical protein